VPVSLNFKGQEVFKTFIGGVTTIVTVFLIVWFSVGQFSMVVSRGNTSINTNEIRKDLFGEVSSSQIGREGVRLGIGGGNILGGPNYLYDPDYFIVEFINIIEHR